MDIKKAIGMTLRRIRVKNGLSQEDVAFETDVSRSYISDLERGVKEPSLSIIFRLCKILKIRPSEFIVKLENRLK